MKTIKFRFWHIDDQKYYYHMNSGLYLMLQGYMNNVESTLKVKTVFPQQFSGLLDSKGNEIYEGDIVEFNQYDLNKFNSKITFEIGCFGYESREDVIPKFHHLSYWPYTKTIIGNIFENPELLK